MNGVANSTRTIKTYVKKICNKFRPPRQSTSKYNMSHMNTYTHPTFTADKGFAC